MAERKAELWAILYDATMEAQGLVSHTRHLAEERGMVCRAWILSPEATPEMRRALYFAGAQRVTHLWVPELTPNCERAVRDFLAENAKNEAPAAILFISSVFSCAVAPGVAALLATGITADCTQLFWSDNGNLIQSRPAFGGRTQADIQTMTLPIVATVRSGVFHTETTFDWELVKNDSFSLGDIKVFCRVIKSIGAKAVNHLGKTNIVISGGAGMGTSEEFNRLYQLAEKLGGDVGASRGAVAAGFAPYERQIGQTGITVRPEWYLAFGISGAVQHLSGMIDAQHIVAVNPDRMAPIHRVSDYSIYAPAGDVVQQLLTALA